MYIGGVVQTKGTTPPGIFFLSFVYFLTGDFLLVYIILFKELAKTLFLLENFVHEVILKMVF